MQRGTDDAAGILARLFPVWDELSASEQSSLAQVAVIRSFLAGDRVHGGTSDCTGVLFVVKGSLRVYVISPEGREITLFHMGTGDVCVLSSICALSMERLDITIDAREKADILVVQPDRYDHLVETNLAVRAYSYELVAKHFSQVMMVMEQALFSSFDKRLAAYLLSNQDATGRVHMTHDAIAQEVGSAREVVSRMLKHFESKGYVSLRRGVVHVKNSAALKALV